MPREQTLFVSLEVYSYHEFQSPLLYYYLLVFMVEECMFAEEIANHKALDTVDVEKILIQQIQQY